MTQASLNEKMNALPLDERTRIESLFKITDLQGSKYGAASGYQLACMGIFANDHERLRTVRDDTDTREAAVQTSKNPSYKK